MFKIFGRSFLGGVALAFCALQLIHMGRGISMMSGPVEEPYLFFWSRWVQLAPTGFDFATMFVAAAVLWYAYFSENLRSRTSVNITEWEIQMLKQEAAAKLKEAEEKEQQLPNKISNNIDEPAPARKPEYATK
jgi:hypothetical protein